MLGVEKKSVAKLQEERTVRKICLLDSHVVMAFAGLTADARILINRAQVECQSHKLSVEDPVTIEYITRSVPSQPVNQLTIIILGIRNLNSHILSDHCRYIAGLKQKYTQSNGRRPFGISCLIGGFDYDGQPHLYQTEPSGIYYEWKANATGRSAKTVREFLEKYYKPEEVETEDGAVKLAIKALLEVAQSGQKNLEVAVMERDKPLKMLDVDTIEKYVNIIEKEKEEEAEKKKQKK